MARTMSSIGVLSTDPLHGYSLIFSPFSTDKIAVVGGLNYGIAGSGGLLVFNRNVGPEIIGEHRLWRK